MRTVRWRGGGRPDQRTRALRAASGVAVALAIVCFVDVPGSFGRAFAGMHAVAEAHSILASDGGADAESIAEDAQDTVVDLFEILTGPMPGEEGALPEAFGEEVADPQAMGCSWTVCEGDTVALYFETPLKGAKERVERQMAGNGWVEVKDASGDYCSTYVKGSGRYRWAYVVYSEVSSTSIACFTLQGTTAEQEGK